MTKYNLKFLYRAVYFDGSKYDQNVEDISVSDPGKSCYNDLNLNRIHYFTLSDGVDSYTLDLSDGGFSINGCIKFYLTDKHLDNIKLVHYRRVVMRLAGDERSYTVNFVLGYEAKVDNEIVTQYIIIR